MGYLRFATNDDTTMLAIAAGGYGGKPSPYVVNIHFLIGYILKTLYTVIPAVNWFTVLYLLLYFSSFIFIVYILAETFSHRRIALVMCFLTAGLSFYLLLSFFSFTVVAYALLSAGMMGVIYSAEGIVHAGSGSRLGSDSGAGSVAGSVDDKTCSNKLLISVSIVYIILAAMMRADVINTAIVITAVYGLVMTVLSRNWKRLVAVGIILTVLGAIEAVSVSTNSGLLNRDPAEAVFYEWGESRSKALDCVQVPFDEELFSEHDFSKASYDACYGTFYYVRDAVSEEKMKLLSEWNTHRYDPHIIGFIKSHFMAYITPGYRRIWQGLFVFVIMAGMISGDKEGRKKILAVYSAVIIADYAYHFIGRPMLHVMMPTYVMGSLIGLALLADHGLQEQGKKRNRVIAGTLTVLSVILAICVASSVCQEPAKYSMTLTKEEAAALHESREYMREHPDKLFFAMDPAVFAVSTDEDMWHNRYMSEPYNLAGNWEIYSVPSNAMLEYYEIDTGDPGKALPDNDRVVFMESNMDADDPNDGYIIDLYKEYYDMNVRFQQIDKLENGWKVYRLKRNGKQG